MLRLAPEVPKSDSPLLTQALWRRGCGARRHNPLHTRRRATRTGSHRDGRQAASRNAHPFLDPPPYPRYSFYELHHNQAIPQPRTAHTNAFHTHSSNRTLDCQLAYHDAKLRPTSTCSCHKPAEANHQPRSRHSCSLLRFFWRDKPTRLPRSTSDSLLRPATTDHRPLPPRFILNRTPTFASSSGASADHCPSPSCAASSSQTCPSFPVQVPRPSL